MVITVSNVKRYNEKFCQNANHKLHALSPKIKHFTEENAKILSNVFINLIECLEVVLSGDNFLEDVKNT